MKNINRVLKKFSIIIVTYNRGDVLKEVLESLYYLNYPDFEVIVVVGPVTDNTLEILEPYKKDIKIIRCPVINISVARNIGIAASSGTYIAFTDDDAIPHPNWLNKIVIGFNNDEVAGVSSDILLEDGVSFQGRKILGNRLEDYSLCSEDMTYKDVFPYSCNFMSLYGVNSIFRRDYLLNIGGFDEEYEFHLDEIDVCARLTDYGYVINYIEDAAPVYHKRSASHIRNKDKITTNWYVYGKNSPYYIKSYEKVVGKDIVNKYINRFIRDYNGIINYLYDNNHISEDQHGYYIKELERGIKQGLINAERGPLLIKKETLEKYKCDYKKFPNYASVLDNKKTIIFLIPKYKLFSSIRNISTFIYALAKHMSKLGHEVHILTSGKQRTITFEDNIWIHKLEGSDLSGYAIKEIIQINKMSKVDIVQSFINNNLQDQSLGKEIFDELNPDSKYIDDYCKKNYLDINQSNTVFYLGLNKKIDNININQNKQELLKLI